MTMKEKYIRALVKALSRKEVSENKVLFLYAFAKNFFDIEDVEVDE